MVYYPLPLHKQAAFYGFSRIGSVLSVSERLVQSSVLSVSEKLVQSVLSLPIHTEMTDEEVDYIIETVRNYGKL